jgi:cyclomaltodextrinase
MKKEALLHQANSQYSYVEEQKQITLLFRTAKNDGLRLSVIEYNRFYPYAERKNHPMRLYLSDSLFDYFLVEFIPNHFGCIYYFQIVDGADVWFYGEYGLTAIEPIRMGAYEMPRIQKTDVYQAPEWVKKAIFYQIFPDRFRNAGNHQAQLEPWGKEPTYCNLFGGNFRGMTERVSHLVSLGINAVYLTPIALSPTSHRYDTVDYLTIDPLLGTEEEFSLFVKELHNHGIKIILDAVFNHCGSDFFAFRDVLLRQEDSAYRDWFLIDKFPVKVGKDKTYQTFGHEPHMPKLNSANPAVRQYLLSVGKHYIEKFDIDGWRLDVADEVDSEFWRLFRKELKTVKPELFIIGEVWHNADYYLRGDQFDSVQNYQFSEIAENFFLRKNTDRKTFVDQATHLLMMYPKNVAFSLLNQLDSHDVPRILTEAKGDVRRVKQAVLFQLTFPGVPCLYYGDEIGMEGGRDPENRRCMNWNESEWNRDLLSFFRAVIELKKQSTALIGGAFRFISDARLLIYERYAEDEIIRIIQNTTDQTAASGSPDHGELLLGNPKTVFAPGEFAVYRFKTTGRI